MLKNMAKWLVTAFLLLVFVVERLLCCDGIATSGTMGTLLVHAAAMWRHVNVWHLSGNVFCLWMLDIERGQRRGERGERFAVRRLVEGIVIGFLCGLTRWEDATCGFSGVLFAMVGVMWGEAIVAIPLHHAGLPTQMRRARWHVCWRFVTRCLPFALVGLLIPHIDGVLHTASLLMGVGWRIIRRVYS